MHLADYLAEIAREARAALATDTVQGDSSPPPPPPPPQVVYNPGIFIDPVFYASSPSSSLPSSSSPSSSSSAESSPPSSPSGLTTTTAPNGSKSAKKRHKHKNKDRDGADYVVVFENALDQWWRAADYVRTNLAQLTPALRARSVAVAHSASGDDAQRRFVDEVVVREGLGGHFASAVADYTAWDEGWGGYVCAAEAAGNAAVGGGGRGRGVGAGPGW